MEQNGRLQCFLNVPALSEFSYDDILFTVQNTKTEGPGSTDRQGGPDSEALSQSSSVGTSPGFVWSVYPC